MPWNIKRNYGGCKGYAVVKDDGDLVGCHESETKAKAQMRALYASEADAKKMQDKKKKIY
jgi:hypothetical protein